MTKEQYLSLLENKGKYAILYNLLDALGCDPVVCRLRPETIDMIMADLGANRVRFGSFDDAEFDSATGSFMETDFPVYGTGGWFAPNHKEVQSLLYDRSASTVCGVENARWFKGRINASGSTYVNGLFLIPDVFTLPASVTAIPAASINSPDAGYTAASFSLAEFKALEQAGIVFLPAAGSRDGSASSGSTGSTLVSNVNKEGSYWVSGLWSGIIDGLAEYVDFSGTDFQPKKYGLPMDYRYKAQSVRLLIDVTE